MSAAPISPVMPRAAKPAIQSDGRLFYATPGGYIGTDDEQLDRQLQILFQNIKTGVGEPTSLHWWQYTHVGTEYITCEVDGSKDCYSLGFVPVGKTKLVLNPASDEVMEVFDSTDAFCLIVRLLESLKLPPYFELTDVGVRFGPSTK